MAISLQLEAPPLHEDASGALRVGNSRVLLELVMRAFQDGATPETICQRSPTAGLPDIYAVLAYDLRHPANMDNYLDEREQRAHEIRQRVATSPGRLGGLCDRFSTRRIRRKHLSRTL